MQQRNSTTVNEFWKVLLHWVEIHTPFIIYVSPTIVFMFLSCGEYKSCDDKWTKFRVY